MLRTMRAHDPAHLTLSVTNRYTRVRYSLMPLLVMANVVLVTRERNIALGSIDAIIPTGEPRD